MSKRATRNRLRRKLIRAAGSERPIHCDAAGVEWIQAADGDAEGAKPKRFRMRAYTGGPMQVGYYSVPVVIDLAGMTAKAPVPILLNHSYDRIVGHADQVDIGTATLDLAGVVSGGGDDAAQVIASAKQGFPWRASVGARPDKLEFVGEGIQTKVNGKTFTGPLHVARRSTLGEVSFVPVAADPKTSAKVAATAACSEREKPMKFDAWVKALFGGGEVPELTDAQTEALQARYDADVKAAAKKPGDPTGKKPDGTKTEPIRAAVEPPQFDLRAVVLTYEKHVAGVEAKAAKYGQTIERGTLAEILAKAEEQAIALKAQALHEEWPAARLEVELVKAASAVEVEMIRAERPKAAAIHASTRDAPPESIEAAFAMSVGLPKPEKHFKPEALEAAHRSYRNFGLQELLLAAAAAHGYTGRQRIGTDNLREILGFAFPVRAAGGFSTLDVDGILSNTANKMLLDGFDSVPQTWRMIAGTRNVRDFKQVTAYRLTADLEYEEVPAGGEIPHGELGEESYTMQAKTYAKMLTLTRQDIINDDLGAFNDLRSRLGMGASIKLNKVFWTLWVNNSTFFTAARLNYQEGAATALSDAGLATAVQLFRQMAGPDGNLLSLEPALLIVPPDLEGTARKWYVSQEVRDTTASTKTAVANIYQNRFKPIVVPELSNSNYTGYSATAWYLLADPAVLATAVMCFLNGQQAPTIESTDADFNTLGIQLRGYHDFGAAMTEYRGGVKSKGSA